jgi:hypothetical protein
VLEEGKSPQHKLMLEASFLLSEEGVLWLRREGAATIESVVVSKALFRQVTRREAVSLAWFGEPSEEGLAILAETLGRAQLFSHEEVEVIDEKVRAVRDNLLAAHEEPIADVLADEWVFLQTQSWLGAKSRRAFDAFDAAGAKVREVPRALARRIIARTLKKKHLPEHIPLKMLIQAGMKWIAVGGSAAAAIVTPPVGVALGVVTGGFLLLDP